MLFYQKKNKHIASPKKLIFILSANLDTKKNKIKNGERNNKQPISNEKFITIVPLLPLNIIAKKINFF